MKPEHRVNQARRAAKSTSHAAAIPRDGLLWTLALEFSRAEGGKPRDWINAARRVLERAFAGVEHPH